MDVARARRTMMLPARICPVPPLRPRACPVAQLQPLPVRVVFQSFYPHGEGGAFRSRIAEVPKSTSQICMAGSAARAAEWIHTTCDKSGLDIYL